jgi:UDP-N-acetylmuramoylalanine--D-glutamate ligase
LATKIVILGAGESGIGAALLAKQKGYDVFVSDASAIKLIFQSELEAHSIPFESGKHDMKRILEADEVMKSPGIPEKNELVKQIRAKGIPVISEIEFGYRYKGDSKIVAITGSNGKTTTTSLLYHICKTADQDVAIVGNIGFSFARQIALDPKKLYVIEVSSFQLDDIKTLRPDIAILLNITEDHLDRYNYQFEYYIKSKFRIIENQTEKDYFIYCIDDEVVVKHLELLTTNTNLLPFSMKQELKKGGYIKNEQMMLKIQEERVTMSIYDFALKGKHNAYNTMAASIAASTLGIRKEKIREAVSNFHNLEHRMEFVATVKGVDFINDSKATNVNSTWYALESMQKPTILILGGVDKGNDYALVADLVKEKVKAIVCMGTDNSKLIEFFKGKVDHFIEVDSAKKAVNASFKLAEKGDVVLLSPACASFDLFKNYEDRGQQFKESVKEL